MIQKTARFLLIIFAYPFLPMKDPGTSCAPSVARAQEEKGSNNLAWLFGWYFGVVGLATLTGGETASNIAALTLILFLATIFEVRLGVCLCVLLAMFGDTSYKVLACVVILLSLGHAALVYGLKILAMEPHEFERERKNGNDL